MFEQLNIFEMMQEPEEEDEKLTPRQWQLYRLIKRNSLIERRKTTQWEICSSIRDYSWNYDEKCHDHCPAVWKDVCEINLSFRLDKLIISKDFEYWIGNEEETQQFLDDLWKQLEPRLMRYWMFKKKISRDGQGKLLSNNLDVIDESSRAREFIESYNPNRVGD